MTGADQIKLTENLYAEVAGAGQEAKTSPSCTDVVGKRKKSDFFKWRGVFSLDKPFNG